MLGNCCGLGLGSGGAVWWVRTGLRLGAGSETKRIGDSAGTVLGPV
jgi:hypothetical protein